MGENVVKNGFFSCVYEGNKDRFRFCHPDKNKFQLIDSQLIGFLLKLLNSYNLLFCNENIINET